MKISFGYLRWSSWSGIFPVRAPGGGGGACSFVRAHKFSFAHLFFIKHYFFCAVPGGHRICGEAQPTPPPSPCSKCSWLISNCKESLQNFTANRNLKRNLQNALFKTIISLFSFPQSNVKSLPHEGVNYSSRHVLLLS